MTLRNGGFVHSLHGTYHLGMHPSASITWFIEYY